MWWDRNGEESPGEAPAFALPILQDVNGTPRFFYIGWYIRDAQRHPDVPRLTTLQREALDLIETVANDPTFHVEMDFQPGDIQLLNNAVILHSPRGLRGRTPTSTGVVTCSDCGCSAHDFASVETKLRTGIPTRTSG